MRIIRPRTINIFLLLQPTEYAALLAVGFVNCQPNKAMHLTAVTRRSAPQRQVMAIVTATADTPIAAIPAFCPTGWNGSTTDLGP
jgi:hypothetical protein